jgi:hypothetical protein
MRTPILLLLLAGCAASRTGGGGEDELARQLAGRVAAEPRGCVLATGGQGLTIIAPGTVGHRRGDTLWVNRLGPACSGMSPLDTLIVEAHGSQICRGDRVRAVEPGRSIAGPPCILGDFIPYRPAG